jgi:hypothetical protein
MSESSQKAIYLSFLSSHIMWGVSSQVIKIIEVFSHCHVPLGEGQKFSLLDLHDASGDVILPE